MHCLKRGFKILKNNYFFMHLKMNFIQLLIYIIVRRVEKKGSDDSLN